MFYTTVIRRKIKRNNEKQWTFCNIGHDLSVSARVPSVARVRVCCCVADGTEKFSPLLLSSLSSYARPLLKNKNPPSVPEWIRNFRLMKKNKNQIVGVKTPNNARNHSIYAVPIDRAPIEGTISEYCGSEARA